MKKAFITGITGQAGAYLSEILLSEGYQVIGLIRRTSTTESQWRLKGKRDKLILEYGDVTDPISIISLLQKYKPDEFYNLAAQSHVWISFKEPMHTFDVTAKGTLNCLEALRLSPVANTCRFFQASSSEMFGANVSYEPDMLTDIIHRNYNDLEPWQLKNDFFQDELTPFAPQSPYAIAKLAAHNYCKLYRKAYNLHISCGIMFNYESPLRGEEFVTRKITKYLADYVYKLNNGHPTKKLELGNISSFRDWSFAYDTMKAAHLILQHEPDDYVIGSGETHSVQEFLDEAIKCAKEYTRFPINDISVQNPDLYRPCEVPYLRVDAKKIRRLGWEPVFDFKSLVRLMVSSDMNKLGVKKIYD